MSTSARLQRLGAEQATEARSRSRRRGGGAGCGPRATYQHSPVKDEGRPPHGRGAVLDDACVCDNKTSGAGMPRAHLVRGLRRASRRSVSPGGSDVVHPVRGARHGRRAHGRHRRGRGAGRRAGHRWRGRGDRGGRRRVGRRGSVTVGDGTGMPGCGGGARGRRRAPGRVVGSTAFVDFFGFFGFLAFFASLAWCGLATAMALARPPEPTRNATSSSRPGRAAGSRSTHSGHGASGRRPTGCRTGPRRAGRPTGPGRGRRGTGSRPSPRPRRRRSAGLVARRRHRRGRPSARYREGTAGDPWPGRSRRRRRRRRRRCPGRRRRGRRRAAVRRWRASPGGRSVTRASADRARTRPVRSPRGGPPAGGSPWGARHGAAVGRGEHRLRRPAGRKGTRLRLRRGLGGSARVAGRRGAAAREAPSPRLPTHGRAVEGPGVRDVDDGRVVGGWL